MDLLNNLNSKSQKKRIHVGGYAYHKDIHNALEERDSEAIAYYVLKNSEIRQHILDNIFCQFKMFLKLYKADNNLGTEQEHKCKEDFTKRRFDELLKMQSHKWPKKIKTAMDFSHCFQ